MFKSLSVKYVFIFCLPSLDNILKETHETAGKCSFSAYPGDQILPQPFSSLGQKVRVPNYHVAIPVLSIIYLEFLLWFLIDMDQVMFGIHTCSAMSKSNINFPYIRVSYHDITTYEKNRIPLVIMNVGCAWKVKE